MKTIKLPTYNITISYTNGDQTNPKIVSDMKNKNLRTIIDLTSHVMD